MPGMEIPDGLLPEDAQVPLSVQTPEERERFNLCFAVTRLITEWDDPVFCRQLYDSDLKTGDLADEVESSQAA